MMTYHYLLLYKRKDPTIVDILRILLVEMREVFYKFIY